MFTVLTVISGPPIFGLGKQILPSFDDQFCFRKLERFLLTFFILIVIIYNFTFLLINN